MSKFRDPHEKEFRQAIGARDMNEVRSMIETLAYRGSPRSAMYIADGLRSGTLYEKDLEKAEGWYRIAESLGYPCANHGIGIIYRASDKKSEAIDYFRKSASSGCGASFNFLGISYALGQGVDIDLNMARSYWEMGAKLGHIWSKINLARILTSGRFGKYLIPAGVSIWILALIEMLVLLLYDKNSERLR